VGRNFNVVLLRDFTELSIQINSSINQAHRGRVFVDEEFLLSRIAVVVDMLTDFVYHRIFHSS